MSTWSLCDPELATGRSHDRAAEACNFQSSRLGGKQGSLRHAGSAVPRAQFPQ